MKAIGQSEWDFRDVPEAESCLVARYEYARNAPQAREIAVRSLDKILDPPEMLRTLDRDFESQVEWAARVAIAFHPDWNGVFPTEGEFLGLPYVKLAPAKHDFFSRSPAAFKDISEQALIGRFSWEEIRERRAHVIAVNWDRPKEEILNGFKSWLEYWQPFEKKDLHVGKSRFHGIEQLKWLAAWRLHHAGMKHLAAKSHIAKTLKRKANHLCCTPSAWSKWVSKADQILSKLQ